MFNSASILACIIALGFCSVSMDGSETFSLRITLGLEQSSDRLDLQKVSRWNNDQQLFYVPKDALVVESGIDKFSTAKADNRVIIKLQLKPEIAHIFQTAVRATDGEEWRLIVMLNGKVISCSAVPTQFTGLELVCSTNLTFDEAGLLSNCFECFRYQSPKAQ